MKRHLLPILVGMLIVPMALGCQNAYMEKRIHRVRIETDPPGAQVWYQDQTGQHPLGRGPVTLEREYQVSVHKFNPWWILWTALSAGVTAGGGVWIDRAPGSDDTQEGLAISLILTGGLTFLLSATGLFGSLAFDGDEFPVTSDELMLGAQLDGYTQSSLSIKIPDRQEKISMLLHPVGMAVNVAGDLSIIVLQSAEFQPVFPHQLPRYAKQGLGKIEIENRSTLPMDVELELSIEGWAEPALSKVKLAAGAKAWVPVKAAFVDKLLRNAEQRTVQAIVQARFVHDDLKRSVRKSFPVTILEGNAFSWSRPSGIASFVNGQDPKIEAYATELFRQFAAAHPGQARASHPLHNHLLALFAFQALAESGIRYKPDTERPFGNLSQGAIDTVQFPSQTLERKVGDCDDLAVLYASLLESLGVPSALVPVTGHVFSMYDSGLRKENRAAFPVDAAKTVIRGESLWVPVETTLLGRAKRFEEAWMAGAENYKGKYKVTADEVVEIRPNWIDFPPVALGSHEEALKKVGVKQALADSSRMLNTYLARVRKQAGRSRGLARAVALLEAGMFDDAAKIFAEVLAKKKSYRGRYGLAVALAGGGRILKALVAFQDALAMAPDKQARFHCQLAIAQCYKVNGNLPKARKYLKSALAINPATKFDSRYRSLFAYLEQDDKTKAAGAEETPRFFQEMLSGM
jgi:tetratricopeptide (TPR) repeat protein